MKNKSAKKFTYSLLAGNLAMTIIGAIIAVILINYFLHQYFLDDIAQKDKLMLYSVKQNMESFLQDATDTLKSIDLSTDYISGVELDQEIKSINQINGYFEDIEVLDMTGVVINTIPENADQIGHNRSGEEYFRYLSNHTEIYWSLPFISSVTGEPTVTVAMKKEDRIIAGYLSLKNIYYLTNKFTEADQNLEAVVLDGYGRYISSYDYNRVSQRQIDPNFNMIIDKSSSKWPAEFIKNDEHLGFAVKIESPEWYLVIYDDYANSMKRINTLLYLFSSLFFAAILIFTIVTLYRSARSSQYINHFVEQTESIAAGNFESDLPEQKYVEFRRLAKSFRMMTENLSERDQRLEQMAYTDSLTGAYNRTYLCHADFCQMYKSADVFGLIFLDIDNFKNINDNHGHIVGDQLLIETCKMLQECITDQCVIARFGGDEFLIIIPDNRDRQIISEIIHRIIGSFNRPVKIEPHSFFVTLSAGISVGERQGYDFDRMLKAADIAMYQVKGSGKNNYKFYNPEMDKKVKKRLQVEQSLRTALDNNELFLAYQPLVFAKDASIRGFEALLRWESKDLGPVSPLDFIPIAEETGMIIRIGEWVLRNACEMIKSINSMNGTDYVMSVNISPIEINSPNFIRNLYEIIEETGTRKEWIEVEITENVFLTNIEEVTTIILHLTLNGISVSLDDFGTGYSSLSYLNKLPIKTLKIDREFIRNLRDNKNNQNMVESIILLAHKMGIFLVAEGVEERAQVEILNEFSCDCIQGFLFSKPLKQEELSDFLNMHERVEP